ncbi:MAG: CapA family protein [Chloroflexi bacterium]|nr:CapA family protein [Chloroflexota bacterium]
MTDQTGSGDEIVIHAVGNVGPTRLKYGEPVEADFVKVHKKIKEADISLCHLDKIFSNGGCLQYRDHNTWSSRVDPENARALVFAGFNMVCLASNRCFDYGPEALVDTINTIRGNGMGVIGAGKDIAEARKPVILERKGITSGFLAYNAVVPIEYEAREGKPGCTPLRVSTYYEAQGYQPGTPPKIITIPSEQDIRTMEEDIRKLRKQVDVLVVSIHWGQDFTPEGVAPSQVTIGHRAIDAGADLIHGHHGHTIRGIETYKGRIIFYCVGTFAQEGQHHEKPPQGVQDANVPDEYRSGWQKQPGWERNPGPRDRRYTMMVKCIAGKKGVKKVSFLPTWTDQRTVPEFLPRKDERFEEVLRYTERSCKEFGTTLRVEGDEVVVFGSDKG